MTESNRTLVASLIESIDVFLAGGRTIGGIRAELWQAVGLLERGGVPFGCGVESAAVDLEEIEFTMGSAERQMVAHRLKALRRELSRGLEG